jgi:hypothetical protein
MAKKTPAPKKVKKTRTFERAKIGKRPPRNFWFDGFAGVSEEPIGDDVDEDGDPVNIPLRTTKRFGAGERYILAGADIIINQRSSADNLGAVVVGKIEARALADGTLLLRMFALRRDGSYKRVHKVRSHRFGVTVDQTPLSEETVNG